MIEIWNPLQISRIRECEKLLVAVDLADKLGDTDRVMEATVQCYKRLFPFLQHGVSFSSVQQLLLMCLGVFKGVLSNKTAVSPQTRLLLLRLVASICMYAAKVRNSTKLCTSHKRLTLQTVKKSEETELSNIIESVQGIFVTHASSDDKVISAVIF